MGNLRSIIYLQTRQGNKPKGVRVVLSIDGTFSGGMTKATFTDEEGKAVIEHSSRGNATIFVNGKDMGRFVCPGEKYLII